jgi:toxin secretion/phage lysis holin
MDWITDHLMYITALVVKAFEGWTTKLAAGVVFSVGSFFFDSLHTDALYALFALIIFDFLAALLAAYRGRVPIESRKVFKTALKIAVYFGVVSAAYITETAVPISLIDEVILGFLVVTELISILENAAKAGFAVPTGLLRVLTDYKNKQ